MTVKFKSYEDIIEYAVQREKDSISMYLDLAQRMSSPNLQQAFIEFAKEEQQHADMLEFELIKAGKAVNFNKDDFVFETAPPLDDPDMTIDIDFKDALLLAVKKEESSFKLYSELAAHAKDPELKNALLQLAEEEVRHKLRFELEYRKLIQDSE